MFGHIQVETIFCPYYLIRSLLCLNILNIKTIVFWTYTFLLKIFKLDVLRWRLLDWVWKHQSIAILNIIVVLIRQLLNVVDSILVWNIVIWSIMQRSLRLLLLRWSSCTSSAIWKAFGWQRNTSLVEIQRRPHPKSACVIYESIIWALSTLFVKLGFHSCIRSNLSSVSILVIRLWPI